ncbi:MAG: response regulator transcription factor [Rhizobiales bacterium]|nr:response regulator transcription factor [Hyphomicrobiales bacterium]
MADNQTVFIVDDDEAVRESLAVLLSSSGNKVAVFDTGTSFLEALDADQNGCLIIDVRMPGLSGLEVLEKLSDMKVSLPVIIMTGHGDLPMAVQAMKAGAIDFVEKPFEAGAIAESVQIALSKGQENWQKASHVAEIEQRIARLTTREREVLEELVIGNLNKIIAFNLDISPRTVEIHRARAMEKMQARNLAHLVRLAVSAGINPQSEAAN